MDESEFITSIDCCFPYRAPLQWRRTIADALKISPNAAFMVAHELCRPPRSVRVTVAQRLETWRYLSVRLHHPLAQQLSDVIALRIKGSEIPMAVAVKAMKLVRHSPNQYNALSICYFSYSGMRKVDELYDRIVGEWQSV